MIALAALPALSGLLSILRIALLRAARLRDLALQLIRERIQLGLRQLELFRVVAQHALRRAFHAPPQFINLAARRLAGLPRLRQVTFPQHVAGEIEDFAAFLAFGRLLQPVVKVARHPAAVQQFRPRLLHRVLVGLAHLAHAVVELPGK